MFSSNSTDLHSLENRATLNNGTHDVCTINHYRVLGIGQNADTDDVIKAYQDKVQLLKQSKQSNKSEQLRKYKKSFNVLFSYHERRQYDEQLTSSRQPSKITSMLPNSSFNSLIDQAFERTKSPLTNNPQTYSKSHMESHVHSNGKHFSKVSSFTNNNGQKTKNKQYFIDGKQVTKEDLRKLS